MQEEQFFDIVKIHDDVTRYVSRYVSRYYGCP